MAKKQEGFLTSGMVNKFKKNFVQNPANKVALNAVTRGNLAEIAINRDVLNDVNFCFSNEIETDSVTDQKRAGTCWLFAILNWFRTYTRKKINVKSFEFSENQVMFWDKFEKANFFMEAVIDLGNCDIDDRKLRFLLENPAQDGGEWHMMVNIVKKYGLMPKEVMVDTFNRENTRYLNEILYYMLRQAAGDLRKMMAAGKKPDQLRRKKNAVMDDVFRILSIFFGMPPEKFNWSYKDNDKKFHREIGITPQAFFDKYVGLNLDETYVLLSCPTDRTPYNKTFKIELFDNMVGGIDWMTLNVPVGELKKIAVKMLKKGDAVLFGCDVVQHSHSKAGILDPKIFDYETLFNVKMNMSKTARVDMGQTKMTHSMVLTAVDLVDGKPVKWKIENSWGTEVGQKGYFIMSDEWFDAHTFDLVVPREYMPPRLLKLFDQKPVVLPPWFPMA
ncbi:C1 family peptidase [bacterium]|nr:C1 family peptidase [candidate division CSSED10-310 bacterium]